MAYRARIASCLYVTEAGTYQTWHRDQDDRIRWRTFPTIAQATGFRDQKRRERAELLKTPRPIRVAQRLGELLNPQPKQDMWTRVVAEYNEDDTPDGALVYRTVS